ncbi:hypothetical protein [Anaerobium acetethylicum]|uniref:Uncharacterized protein n=1 Tax=Anaerobium acetethylicum TaxID=1619234 RepID=A0A1D3TQ39_9FIRM|nr:hypothetical protein [Anaerobium acetethylicum]SCP95613.1 hypothetical protein SAMN05421730_100263 [Anaerobium acetethylicum]
MGRLEDAKKVGLREKETERLIAVYPYEAGGTDAEIEKAVSDWYYEQYCSAEEELRNAYVDALTEEELNANK